MKGLVLIILYTALYVGNGEVFAQSNVKKIVTVQSLIANGGRYSQYKESLLYKELYNDPDSVFQKHANLFINQSRTLGNGENEYKGHMTLGKFYFYNYNYAQAKGHFSTAERLAKSAIDLFQALLFQAEIESEQNHLIESLEYLRQARQQVEKTDDTKQYVLVLLKESFCYTQLNKFDIAETHLNKAYSLIEGNVIREYYGEFFKYQGLYYFKQLNYLNALASFYKGLEFFEQDTVLTNYGISLQYLGKIYSSQTDYTKAFDNLYDAQAIFSALHDTKSQGLVNYELGKVYLNTKDFVAAMQYMMQSIETLKSSNNLVYTNLSIIGMASIFREQIQPDSAIKYLKQTEPWILNTAEADVKFEYYYELTHYFLQKHKSDSAILSAQTAEKYLALGNGPVQKLKLLQLWTSVYEKTKKFDKAYAAQKKFIYLNDSINHQINTYDIKVLQTELELLKKKVVIENLMQERDLQNKALKLGEKQLEKQKTFLGWSLATLLMLLGSVFTLWAFLYLRRKDNLKLNSRNKQIAQQKEEIEIQSQHLMEINEELEKLSIVARETDNGIKTMDAKGRVIWVNEGYIRMHGYTLEELQKREDLDLLGEQATIDIQQLVNVWYGDKKPISFESLNRTKQNKEIWVQTTLTPILDADGKIDRMIAIDSDITRIKQAEKEILIKNQDITSSISYAKRIQEAMMSPINILTSHFPDSFCLLKPKSIVSGDFYWISYRHERLVVACADSTGHGVPGAFMSLIGMSFLNKIVNEKGFVSPAIILNRLRMNILNHLQQKGNDIISGDGMDISIITIDIKTKQLEYAGAMNPIIVIRKDEIIELKPDKMPVGYFDNEERPFSSTVINLEPNDQIYMFTDGYYDQFGGKVGAKMKSNRFRSLLLQASKLPSNQQKSFIENEFEEWRGSQSQVDDVLIMGITIN